MAILLNSLKEKKSTEAHEMWTAVPYSEIFFFAERHFNVVIGGL
jgi:hypothetical protein